jgi:hypothetical protein
MGDDVSEPTLTDAAVQAIVDDHAPSQGESWDMAAMLREAYAAGLAAGAAQQRETDAAICEERSRTERGAFDDGEVVYPHPGYVSDILAAAIRAQQEAK